MADPTDAVAREAIATNLGGEPGIVEGDRISIDRLVAELWREEEQTSSHLLVYAPAGSEEDQLGPYAEYLADLLSASLDYAPRQASLDALLRHAPLPVLIAHRPHWPLQRLLLVIQGETTDEKATDWALRLTRARDASVAALAVVPPVPAMYHGLTRMEGGLAELLTTDTPLGREMRQVARRLVDGNVDGTLLLRQGSPEWEIRRDLVHGQFDLLVIGAAPQDGVRRWFLGDLPVSLTRVVDRPILVAR
jgi:nucleotide-binding universal stress UspA family protein